VVGQVWDDLESHAAVLFPRPCHGRIPNCAGSAVACPNLSSEEWGCSHCHGQLLQFDLLFDHVMLCPNLDLERSCHLDSCFTTTIYKNFTPLKSAIFVIDQVISGVQTELCTPARWTFAAASSPPRCFGGEGSPLHWSRCPEDGFGDGQENRAMAVGW